MRKVILLIIALIIIISVSYFVLSRENEVAPSISQQTVKSNQSVGETTVELQPQINEEGGVSVEVSSGDFNFNNPKFEITFSTHQGSLDFDLTKISVLFDGQNRQYPPLQWQGGRGGHHLSGTLVFPAIDKDTKTIRLIIKDVYEIKERAFLWELE